MEELKGPWKPKYTKILIYAERGMQVKDIAEKVGMNANYVGRIMGRADFVAKITKLEADTLQATKDLLMKHAMEAGLKMISTMRKGKAEERLQYDAAKEILYQVGLKPVEVIETRKREYTPEELQSAFKVTQELEEITDRLSTRPSRYLVEPTPSAPVPATNAEIAGGDLKLEK